MMIFAGRSFYDDLEAMSRTQKRDYYDEKVRWIVRHAYEHAPAIREKMDLAGVGPSDIQSVDDMTKIPITSKDDLIGMQKKDPPFGGLLTVPLNRLKSICMSPGPIYNAPGSDETFLRRVEKAYFGCGVRPGDILLNAFSYHVSPMGILLDTPLKRLGVTVIPMGGGNKQLQVQVILDLKVTVFTGSAGFLLDILQTAEQMGYDPRKDFKLRLLISPFDRDAMKTIERDYGIRGTEFYGTADVGIVAYNCDERSGMHVCEDALLEIVDMNSGAQLGPNQVGKVVITPFDETYPLIRFSPGDLSSWEERPCSCGRTSMRLNPIIGWIGEAVKVRGMFVHPSQLASVVAKFPGIEKYQLVCSRINQKDFLTFRFEPGGVVQISEEMTQSFRDQFRDLCRLNLDSVERAPAGSIPPDAKPIVDERPSGSIRV